MRTSCTEEVLLITARRDMGPLSKYRGFGVFSMNKTWGRQIDCS
jgi:hypothetical protein